MLVDLDGVRQDNGGWATMASRTARGDEAVGGKSSIEKRERKRDGVEGRKKR